MSSRPYLVNNYIWFDIRYKEKSCEIDLQIIPNLRLTTLAKILVRIRDSIRILVLISLILTKLHLNSPMTLIIDNSLVDKLIEVLLLKNQLLLEHIKRRFWILRFSRNLKWSWQKSLVLIWLKHVKMKLKKSKHERLVFGDNINSENQDFKDRSKDFN